MRDPDDIPGADGPPPEVRVNVGYLNLLRRFTVVFLVIACAIATQTCVWLKLQARATENVQVWIENENQRGPASRNVERDKLAAKICREFPMSSDERHFIAGSGAMPAGMTIALPAFLLAMVVIIALVRKPTTTNAAKTPLIAAAVGALLACIGAIATFGPFLI